MSDYAPLAPTKGSVVPYLQIDGAIKAAHFYEEAFGARIAAMQPADDQGRTMHVHLYINDGSLMLSDFYAEHGMAPQKPAAFSVALMLEADIDEVYQRAVNAGCTGTLPPQDMFWGDRYAQLTDPFGVSWALNMAKG